MRFLEFVPCGRKACQRRDQVAHRRRAEEAAAPVNPLQGSAAAAPSREKRRSRTAGARAADPWRPTLGQISEDAVLRAEAGSLEKGRPAAAAEADRVKSAAPWATSRRRDYRDGDRYFTAPAAFQAFAPTAFLF